MHSWQCSAIAKYIWCHFIATTQIYSVLNFINNTIIFTITSHYLTVNGRRTRPGGCPSALFPMWLGGHSWYCSKQSPQNIFPIDRHYKRDVYKTVDRIPRTTNKVANDSFYDEFLIHWDFIFVKLLSSWEKWF